MTGGAPRGIATTVKLSHHRWGWTAQVRWLPDSTDDAERFGVEKLERGYLNLAEAVATSADPGTAVQLRILSTGARGHSGGGHVAGRLSAWVVGIADTQASAERLWRLVAATLPDELPVQGGNPRTTEGVLTWLDGLNAEGTVLEVRRRIEDARPIAGVLPLDEPADVTVLRWDANQHALRTALPLLASQPDRAALLLHIEPTHPSEALLLRLADVFQSSMGGLGDGQGGEYGPLLRKIAAEAGLRLRVLPRGALGVRVAIAGRQPIVAGTAEAIGMDLTGLGGFEIHRPTSSRELSDALALFLTGESLPWQEHPDPVVEELRHLADPAEAATVVRFPQPPRGGLPGMPSAPLSTLPRTPQLSTRPSSSGNPSVNIGSSPYGGAVHLSLRELNQHTLVAGLPGFGKTQTVHTILRELWSQHGIPFLVLDPAKSDYGNLVDQLEVREGIEPQRVVLTPDRVAFNPFVVPQGVTTNAHAGRVLGAFDAALQLSAQWPLGHIMLTRGLFRAYEDAGPGVAPTLRSVYAALGDMIRAARLDARSEGDVRASLLGRLESMVRGPLGAALTGASSSGIDWESLLRRPTVIEFRGFAGPTERSLIFGLLVAGLASYREANPPPVAALQHVTVLEEAHRVVSNRGPAEAEGVRLLAESIAELRGSGEGFIIVDQAPTMLHPVVRKVTGSVISHRLIEPEERSIIGSALLLDPRQSEDLARLPVGQAVIYGADRVTATVTDVAAVVQAASQARPVNNSLSTGAAEPLICVGCTSMCTARDAGRELADATRRGGGTATDLIDVEQYRRTSPAALWCGVAHLTGLELPPDRPAGYLATLHERRGAFLSVARQVKAARESATNGVEVDRA